MATVAVSITQGDPHAEDLRRALEDYPEITCVGSHTSAQEALAALPRSRADVAVVDINLPDMSGIDFVAEIKQQRPSLAILVLAASEERESVFAALCAGATGYLLKPTPAATLVSAIVELHEGGAPLSPSVARMLVQYVRQPRAAEVAIARLTPREHQVLEALAQGYRYKEMTDHLRFSMGTLRSHLASIYHKLQVKSRTEATAKYLRR